MRNDLVAKIVSCDKKSKKMVPSGERNSGQKWGGAILLLVRIYSAVETVTLQAKMAMPDLLMFLSKSDLTHILLTIQ